MLINSKKKIDEQIQQLFRNKLINHYKPLFKKYPHVDTFRWDILAEEQYDWKSDTNKYVIYSDHKDGYPMEEGCEIEGEIRKEFLRHWPKFATEELIIPLGVDKTISLTKSSLKVEELKDEYED